MGSKWRSKLFHFSLSTLEIKERNFNILFLFLKVDNILSDLSFPSRKCPKAISGAGLEISECYEHCSVVLIIGTKGKQIWECHS